MFHWLKNVEVSVIKFNNSVLIKTYPTLFRFYGMNGLLVFFDEASTINPYLCIVAHPKVSRKQRTFCKR